MLNKATQRPQTAKKRGLWWTRYTLFRSPLVAALSSTVNMNKFWIGFIVLLMLSLASTGIYWARLSVYFILMVLVYFYLPIKNEVAKYILLSALLSIKIGSGISFSENFQSFGNWMLHSYIFILILYFCMGVTIYILSKYESKSSQNA